MRCRSPPEGPPRRCLGPPISVSPSAAGCGGQDMKDPYGNSLRSAPRPVVWHPCCRPPAGGGGGAGAHRIGLVGPWAIGPENQPQCPPAHYTHDQSTSQRDAHGALGQGCPRRQGKKNLGDVRATERMRAMTWRRRPGTARSRALRRPVVQPSGVWHCSGEDARSFTAGQCITNENAQSTAGDGQLTSGGWRLTADPQGPRGGPCGGCPERRGKSHCPPRMVTCELSRVCCWLRRRQQQISTCRPQEEEKSLSRAENGPRRLSQKVEKK